MVPSISSDLTRVRAALGRMAADESLPPVTREDLADLDGIVRLIERSWPRMVGHLQGDVERLRSAIADIMLMVAEPSRPDVEADLGGLDWLAGPVDHLDPQALADRSQRLRSFLSRLILATETWRDPTLGAAVARRAALALRTGLETRPW